MDTRLSSSNITLIRPTKSIQYLVLWSKSKHSRDSTIEMCSIKSTLPIRNLKNSLTQKVHHRVVFKAAVVEHLNDMCRHLLAELCRDERAAVRCIEADEYVAERDVYAGVGVGQAGTQEVNEGTYNRTDE